MCCGKMQLQVAFVGPTRAAEPVTRWAPRERFCSAQPLGRLLERSDRHAQLFSPHRDFEWPKQKLLTARCWQSDDGTPTENAVTVFGV
ncbi:unnamed protein product [Caenorhabditis auriculariae]|uniref:Uncharacterized protein n=1 Tax=Caenorhabditis auriculariae TaxID=2777116 RepID=A0A8S1H159_9PELO|nr:unnamed protein product [Caenorhabditis auriculariae]